MSILKKSSASILTQTTRLYNFVVGFWKMRKTLQRAKPDFTPTCQGYLTWIQLNSLLSVWSTGGSLVPNMTDLNHCQIFTQEKMISMERTGKLENIRTYFTIEKEIWLFITNACQIVNASLWSFLWHVLVYTDWLMYL